MRSSACDFEGCKQLSRIAILGRLEHFMRKGALITLHIMLDYVKYQLDKFLYVSLFDTSFDVLRGE